jgi:parallel beta helix pectate lyase-like protein
MEAPGSPLSFNDSSSSELPMLARHFTIAAVGFVATSLAHAAGQRTFVSVSGVNNPACSIASPCRDFPTALAATSANGEIIVLDSGGYGAVTIGQSVSIIAPPGVYAGISVFAGDGVTIAAGPTDKVTLRGLTINGQGGNRGIVVTSAGEVHIEQCTVTNMATDGIRINSGSTIEVRSTLVRSNGQNGLNVAAGTPDVRVIDSQFSRNVNDGILIVAGTLQAERISADQNIGNGLRAQPVAAVSVTVTASDSAFTGNTHTGAIGRPDVAGSTARLAFARSTSAGNIGGGFGLNTFNAGTGFLTVSDSAVVENTGNGVIVSGANSIAIVTGSTVARNVGFDFNQQLGGVLRSSGNNALTGRGAPDINGATTSNPPK